MGVEAYCVKFYLAHDLWRVGARRQEMGARCLVMAGFAFAFIWVVFGRLWARFCLCELPILSELRLEAHRGKQIQEQSQVSLATRSVESELDFAWVQRKNHLSPRASSSRAPGSGSVPQLWCLGAHLGLSWVLLGCLELREDWKTVWTWAPTD